jgi:mannose-6-phosphate isomerase-like protein (cupin superfamily)
MTTKETVFISTSKLIEQHGLRIASMDESRPWGGFFVIEEADAPAFIDIFFSMLDKSVLLQGKLSPKILLVAPEKKLSWQYHHRRAEVWKLIDGNSSIIRSETDVQNEAKPMIINELVRLKQGERHRLIGTNDWGIVAEIWIHTDPENPSDENDIVRLEDDFGR